jgi:hypothetical protein
LQFLIQWYQFHVNLSRTDGGMDILPVLCNIKKLRDIHIPMNIAPEQYDPGTVRSRISISLTFCMDYIRILLPVQGKT